MAVSVGRALFISALCFACSGCGGGGGGPSGTTGGIQLSLSQSSGSIQRGSSAQITATVTGTGGFTGAATVSVANVPSGVTIGVTNVQTTGATTTATLTITIAAAAAPGTWDVTVNATAPGVAPVTARFSLTIPVPVTQNVRITLNHDGVTDFEGRTITFAFVGDAALSRATSPSNLVGVPHCDSPGQPTDPADFSCQFDVPSGKVVTFMATDLANATVIGHPRYSFANPTGQVDQVAAQVGPAAFIEFVDPGSRCAQPERGVCVVQATSNATITVRYHRVPLLTLTGIGGALLSFKYDVPKLLAVPDTKSPARTDTGSYIYTSYGSANGNPQSYDGALRVWHWMYVPPGTGVTWTPNSPVSEFKEWGGICTGSALNFCTFTAGGSAPPPTIAAWRYDVIAKWKWYLCTAAGQTPVPNNTSTFPGRTCTLQP